MSQFGGSSREDDFGYFGTPKASGAGSQFGGPPPAQSQFGSPSAPPASGLGGNPAFGAPAVGVGYAAPTPPPPYRGRSRLGAKGILGLLGLGILLLVAGWFGWGVYQSHKAIVIPTTLGGRPLFDDPRVNALAEQSLAQVRSDHPGLTVEAAVYGTEDELTVLVVGRGRIDVDSEWTDAGVTTPDQLGEKQCAVVPGPKVAVCIQSSRTLGVETFVVGGTIEEASAALDEAWAQQ